MEVQYFGALKSKGIKVLPRVIYSNIERVVCSEVFLFPELNNEGLDIMEDYYSKVNN